VWVIWPEGSKKSSKLLVAVRTWWWIAVSAPWRCNAFPFNDTASTDPVTENRAFA
jgi:hypothetical protein